MCGWMGDWTGLLTGEAIATNAAHDCASSLRCAPPHFSASGRRARDTSSGLAAGVAQGSQGLDAGGSGGGAIRWPTGQARSRLCHRSSAFCIQHPPTLDITRLDRRGLEPSAACLAQCEKHSHAQ